MVLVRLTLFNGQTVHVNFDHVVVVETLVSPNAQGSRLRTTLLDKEGRPEILSVQEPAHIVVSEAEKAAKR
jgi:hypothetical protein